MLYEVITTHTHMPYVMGHNQPVDFSQLRSFWDMLQKMGWEWLEDLITQDGIYAATRYAAAKIVITSYSIHYTKLYDAPLHAQSCIVTKSPLSSTILNCYAGGFIGSEIKYCGIDGVIFEGAFSDWQILIIDNDRVSFESAEPA